MSYWRGEEGELTSLLGVPGLEFGLDPPLSSFEWEELRLASSSDFDFFPLELELVSEMEVE